MIKVLIVDDSALIRQLLSSIINTSPELSLVGVASDAYEAKAMVTKHKPDVITLDIEMPKVDGLNFLDKLMKAQPTRVVMISSLTSAGSDATIKALSLGAIDYFPKPTVAVSESIAKYSSTIVKKIINAANAKLVTSKKKSAKISVQLKDGALRRLVGIGASVGGVEAIAKLLVDLPEVYPPIVISQHLPKGFTASFANRLDSMCKLKVMEARGNETLLPGHVYIAPGALHLCVKREGNALMTELSDFPKVSGHKPAVDMMFNSMATVVGSQCIGVILTGMGHDGAAGLKAIRDAGGKTFGQDEETCVVYGMPKKAYDFGAVETQLPLNEMAEGVTAYLKSIS